MCISANRSSGATLHDLDKWDLENAHERRAEFGLPQLDNPKQLAEALELSIGELRWLSYHRDAATHLHYHRFTIPKKDGSERAIWAPLPKLKKTQRWIHHHIVERLPVHGAAHGFLCNRSVLSNARQHVDSRIILKMDLKDFFPTITLPRVKGVFRKAGYQEQVATLLALLCTESPRDIVEHDGKTIYVSLSDRSLPQGAPTSPGLTNVVCRKLDRRLTGLSAKYGWRYTRYADDLTFSLPNESKDHPHVGSLIGGVKMIVKEEGFRVHPEKTRVSRNGGSQKVTGLIVNGKESPRVPRKLRRQIRAALHHLETGKPLTNEMTIQQLEGYIAWVTMSDPELGAKFKAQLETSSRWRIRIVISL